MPRLLMDFTPLRVSVPYRRMWLGTSLSGIGTALTNVVVAGGPRLGDLALGTLGSAAGEATAAVLGGVACAIGVVMFSLAQRGFLRYDAEHPVP